MGRGRVRGRGRGRGRGRVRAKCSSKPPKAGSLASEVTAAQICAVIQLGSGLAASTRLPLVAERKKRHSSGSMRLSPCITLMHTRKEKSSLCASKSERQMLT